MRLLDIPTLRARFGTTTNGTYVPDVVPFDETFWRMIGLSLAEGHIAEDGARRRICWSFHPTAEPEPVEVVRTFWEGCGVKVPVRWPQQASTVRITSPFP